MEIFTEWKELVEDQPLSVEYIPILNKQRWIKMNQNHQRWRIHLNDMLIISGDGQDRSIGVRQNYILPQMIYWSVLAGLDLHRLAIIVAADKKAYMYS